MKRLNFKNIFIISIAFHILSAIFSSGFHHFDEHFQIYEFLNLKLGNITAADLPWEFRERIRPWFQPYIYLSLYKVFYFIGVKSPFIMAFIFRLFTTLLGLLSLWKLRPLIEEWFSSSKEKLVAWALLNLLWFVPYIQTRTNSESLSISFFLLGLSYFLSKVSSEKMIRNSFLAGIFFGFSYLARSQMALCVAFVWFWALFIDKRNYKRLTASAMAIVLINLVGIGIDSLGYGEFTISIWHYYRTNFQEGIMSSVKQYPVYWYLYWAFNRGIPPVSFFLILGTLFSWWKYRKHALVWATLPLFVFHSLVGHKELRYIFPIIMIAPFFIAFIYRDYSEKIDRILKLKWGKFLFNFVLFVNFLFLIISNFRPANPSVNFYRFIYHQPKITKIYAHQEDPFTMLGLPINFYKKKGFETEVFQEFKDLDLSQGKYVFFRKGRDIVEMEKNPNCQLEFMAYPRWSLNFNVGNWLSRSRVWSLFYCQN